MQKTGPGPGVPVPKVPIILSTPNTHLNIVNRSEIVTSPAKGTNNLDRTNNNQPSTQVYLHDGENFQNKSITGSNFSLKTQPLDPFQDAEDTLGEAVRTIHSVFSDGNGHANEPICAALVDDVQEIIDYLNTIVRVGRAYNDRLHVPSVPSIPSSLPTVVPSVVPSILPTLVSDTGTVISNGRPLTVSTHVPTVQGTNFAPTWRAGYWTKHDVLPTPPVIRKPTDYCHEHHKLAKIGRSCPDCEREKSITYCQDFCCFCKRKTKAFQRAEDRVDASQFVQIIKTERVNELRSRASTCPIIPLPGPQPFIPSLQLNRSGNFIDKFLAVTYTLKDTDLTARNILFLEQQLILNFKSFTCLKEFPCKGHVYVIEYTTALVPHLHGIVRLSTELKTNKNITVKNAHFDGKNKITLNGREEPREDKVKILLKPINVSGWIAYMQKHYIIPGHRELVGDLDTIISGWDYQPAPPISPF